jgi:hypothetical protein
MRSGWSEGSSPGDGASVGRVAGVVVGAVVGLALMAGCAGGATEQGTGEGAPAPASPAAGRTTPASPVPATGSAPGPAQVSLQVSTHAVSTEEGENVIWFAVEGGFAHQLRELVVAEDGTTQAVVSGRPSTGHLAAAALARGCSAPGITSTRRAGGRTCSATRSAMRGRRSWPTTPRCRAS